MFKAFVCMFVGLVWAIFAANSTLNDRALEKRGKTAVIHPIEKYTEVTRKKHNRPTDVHYEADLSFTTESGEVVTVKKRITPEIINQFAAGKDVTIRYVADKPSITRLTNEYSASGGEVAFGVIIFVAGLLWFRYASRKAAEL